MKNNHFFIITVLLTIFSFNLYSQDEVINTDEDIVVDENTEINKQETTVTIKKEKNGWDYYAEGNYYESIKALEEEKRNFPNRINIYIILGWNYKMLKNFEKMEEVSLTGMQIVPNNRNIIKNLAESYYFQGKYSNAITEYQKYLKYRFVNKWSDPQLYNIYLYLGYSFYEVKSYHKADIALTQALQMLPNNVSVNYVLGLVNQALKNDEKAILYYKNTLKYQPTHNEAQKKLNEIQS